MNASRSTPLDGCNLESISHSACFDPEKGSRPGWCHGRNPNGTICGIQFSWTPPYLQLCAIHRQQVDHNAPCYFLKLPTELRQEIFRYLMPSRPIDSLVVYQSAEASDHLNTGVPGSSLRTMLLTPLLGLLLGFNLEVYEEVKDVFYKTAIFNIDVSRDGVTLCGRRILGPTGRDGYPRPNDDQRAIDRFVRHFSWTKVRNYSVRIELERHLQFNRRRNMMRLNDWEKEVEVYDLRDFVAVIVSGVLAKARQLWSLQVRVFLAQSDWPLEHVVYNTKLLIGPFERLRNVREPRFMGAFHSEGSAELYGHRHRAFNDTRNRCVTPPLPSPVEILSPHMTAFNSVAANWQRCLTMESPLNILPKSPMTKLFVEFKAFYNKLTKVMPHIVEMGRKCFLHRARVARENEDIVTFRAIYAELLEHWYHRLRIQELERSEVNAALQRMMNADNYPPPPLPSPPPLPRTRNAPTIKPEQQQAQYIDLT